MPNKSACMTRKEMSDAKRKQKTKAMQPHYNLMLRKRRAFVITETELKVIAALAIIGLRRTPKNG